MHVVAIEEAKHAAPPTTRAQDLHPSIPFLPGVLLLWQINVRARARSATEEHARLGPRVQEGWRLLGDDAGREGQLCRVWEWSYRVGVG